MDSKEEKLARLVVTLVRDDVISYFDQLLAGTLVSQYDKAIFADLGSEPVIAREKVLELLPYIVDSTIEGMLEAIRQSETFDLVHKDPEGDHSATDFVESFYGEYNGSEGWVEQFSAQRQGKYAKMINDDIAGIVQQFAADPSWPPKVK